MDDNLLSTTNLTDIEWRFTEWLGANGGLRPDNVLEYFSLSPFWDPTSNNAVLKMQTQFNELQTAQLDLKKMTGIEFAVVHEKWPTLFIIRKQRRKSPNEAFEEVTKYAHFHPAEGYSWKEINQATPSKPSAQKDAAAVNPSPPAADPAANRRLLTNPEFVQFRTSLYASMMSAATKMAEIEKLEKARATTTTTTTTTTTNTGTTTTYLGGDGQ